MPDVINSGRLGVADLDRLPSGWEEQASVEDLPVVAQQLAELAVELERARQLERALRAMTEAVRAQRRVVAQTSDDELLSGGGWRPLATMLGHRRRLLRATGRPGEIAHIDEELAELHERLNRAIQRAAGLSPPSRDESAELRELAGRLRGDGDLAGARAAQERLVAALEPGDADVLAAAVSELASLCWELGDHRAARAAAERAVAIHESSGRPTQPAAARDLTVLGSMLWQLTELPAARDALARAVVVTEEVYGADHVEVARCLAHLGTVHHDLGDFAAARTAQERALAILERRLGPDHRETLFVVHSFGKALRARGDQAGAYVAQQRAVAGYERTLATDEQQLGRNHPRVARTRRRLRQVRRELAGLAGGGGHMHDSAANG
jgi:tetratricopeptide (TPR) repeat protein